MAKSQKSKWILGLTGTALSAFVISQVGANPGNNSFQGPQSITTKAMSKMEKELVQLDWTNFEVNGADVSGGVEPSDRQTRRS